MEKDELVATLQRLVPVEVNWSRLGKRDLEKLVALSGNPRDAAFLFAAKAIQNRAKGMIDTFFDSLGQEIGKK